MAQKIRRSGNKKRVIRKKPAGARRESVGAEGIHDADFLAAVHQWRGVKRQLGYLGEQEEKLKKRLKNQLQESGYTDSEGHLRIDFDEPIDGLDGIVNRKRVTKNLDEEAAERILKKHKLLKSCKKKITTEVFDEDAILAAHYEEEIDDEEMKELFPENVTWALYPVEEAT